MWGSVLVLQNEEVKGVQNWEQMVECLLFLCFFTNVFAFLIVTNGKLRIAMYLYWKEKYFLIYQTKSKGNV